MKLLTCHLQAVVPSAPDWAGASAGADGYFTAIEQLVWGSVSTRSVTSVGGWAVRGPFTNMTGVAVGGREGVGVGVGVGVGGGVVGTGV